MLVTYSAFVYSLLSKMRSTGSLTIPDSLSGPRAGGPHAESILAADVHRRRNQLSVCRASANFEVSPSRTTLNQTGAHGRYT